MSVQLETFDIVKFKLSNEAELFLNSYITDRVTVISLLSYVKKCKVYMFIVDTSVIKFSSYTFFGNLVFKNFDQGKYYLDGPFNLRVSLSTLTKILDANNINYKVDTIGLFFEIA